MKWVWLMLPMGPKAVSEEQTPSQRGEDMTRDPPTTPSNVDAQWSASLGQRWVYQSKRHYRFSRHTPTPPGPHGSKVFSHVTSDGVGQPCFSVAPLSGTHVAHVAAAGMGKARRHSALSGMAQTWHPSIPSAGSHTAQRTQIRYGRPWEFSDHCHKNREYLGPCVSLG